MDPVARSINEAAAANARGDHAAAAELCRRALQLAPEVSEAWYQLGVASGGLGKRSAALGALEKARIRTLGSPDAQNAIGLAFVALAAAREAEPCFRRAQALAPEAPDGWCNLGKLRAEQRRFAEAEALFRAASERQPDNPALHVNLGGALFEQARYDAAGDAFARALELEPQAEFVLGRFLHARAKGCDWRGFAAGVERLRADGARGARVSDPFTALALVDDPALHRRLAESWVSAHCPPRDGLPPFAAGAPLGAGGRLRIGYFSADFHDHATTWLMAGLLEQHDRERFEIVAFSFGPDHDDTMRRRVVAACDRFIDVRAESDRAVAERARALGIDIAVDLKGYTADCRPGIFAWRAAPLQVSFLGYPGTTGASYLDYVVADPVVIPPDGEAHFSEAVARMPACYQVNDSTRRIAGRAFMRDEAGLPAEAFVYCCFNSNYKILPEIFDAWMRILGRVDGSVLWLFRDNAVAESGLRRAAAERGVDPARLVFAGRLPLAEHLARLRLADLFLDTLPCNAHTTASDALWAGVPLLTRRGAAFAGRVAASLLTAVGLPELIVDQAEDYEALAIALATDRPRLAALRQRLEANLPTAPLFDTTAFTRGLEALYGKMVERRQAGLPPAALAVD